MKKPLRRPTCVRVNGRHANARTLAGAGSGLAAVLFGLATIWPGPVAPVTAATATIKVMPLGDSIIDGYGNNPGGARVKLYQTYFKGGGYDVDFVGSLQNGPSSNFDRDHEGHSGWRIDQIRGIIDARMQTYQPDVVMLHIGGNDMFQDYQVSGIGSRLSDLINRICTDKPGVKVVFSTNHDIPSNQSKIEQLNAVFRSVVPGLNTASCSVSMVEMKGVVPSGDLADGIHPNMTGYNKMADVWWPKVKVALDSVRAGAATPTATPVRTPTPTATPASGGTNRADINGDGKVNVTDLSIVLANWAP